MNSSGIGKIDFFSVKACSFYDESKEDPFYFEQKAQKIAGRYIPFSGTVRKRRYILFVKYIDWLIKNEKFAGYSDKDVRTRLEKLLVYCWSSRFQKKSSGIIGIKKEASPFNAKRSGWVKQDCYGRYSIKSNINSIIKFHEDYFEKYFERQYEREHSMLNDFMKRGDNVKNWKRVLDGMVFNKVKAMKKSLFNPTLDPYVSGRVLECIKHIIMSESKKHGNNGTDKITETIQSWNSKKIRKLLEPGSSNLLKQYDNEVKKYIIDVEKQLSSSAKINWGKYKQFNAPIHPKETWFILTKDNIYIRSDEKKWRFISDWKKMVEKAKRDGPFFDYRINSVVSLLQDNTNA